MNVSVALDNLGLPSKDLSVNQAIQLMNYLVKDGDILSQNQLREIVNKVLADTGSPDAVTVLFSGSQTYDGVSTAKILTELDQNNTNLRFIGHTPAAQFLRSDSFLIEVSKSFGIGVGEINSNINSSNFLNGVDGLWGDVSANFVEKTKGVITGIIGEDSSEGRIFSQRELPKILENPNITKIFGFDPIELKSLNFSHSEMFDFLVKQSNIMIKASHLTNSSGGTSSLGARIFIQDASSDFSAFVNNRPDLFANASNYIKSMSAIDQQVYKDFTIREAEKNVVVTTDSDGNKVKYIGPIGKVLLVLGLLVVTTQAASAELSGDHEGAKNIIKDWAVDASGSLAGELIGAAVTGLVTAGLVGAGILSAPVAGALVLAGALVGGIYGADAAKELYELTKDQDDNGRRDLYDRIINVMYGAEKYITSPLMFDLNGDRHTIDANLTQKQIIGLAQSEIAWRFTLRELNPFTVTDVEYDRFNDDHSLDLYSTATDVGMTNQYITDRAAMLTWLLQYYTGQQDIDDQPHAGVKPYNEDWDTDEIEGNWDFIDLSIKLEGGAPLTLAIDGRDISTSDHQVVFGSKEADVIKGAGLVDYLYGAAGDDIIHGEDDHDYLEGGAGKDELYGGAGNDTLFAMTGNDVLDGGEGNDRLTGGLGVDEYLFDDDYGNDTIIDTDGLGSIEIDGTEVKVGKRLGEYLWESQDGKLHIAAVPAGYSTSDGQPAIRVIIARKGDAANSIIIQDWKENGLGLNIPVTPYTPPNTEEIVVQYINNAATPSDSYFRITGTTNSDIIHAADMEGDLDQHNLYVYGGKGSDSIKTGKGNDQVRVDHHPSSPYMLPPEGTYEKLPSGVPVHKTKLVLSYQHDEITKRILGNYFNTVDTNEGNDLIIGGYGSDFINAGVTNNNLSGDDDEVFGHGGADAITGGAGNDTLYGDGIVIKEFSPLSERFFNAGDDAKLEELDKDRLNSLYAPIQMFTQAVNFGYHGDDVIEGEAGDDVIFGEGGDDELYGGDDNDLISADSLNIGIANEQTEAWNQQHGYASLTGYEKKQFWVGLYQTTAAQAGQDKLFGGDGNDHLGGGGDIDRIYGGTGDDIIYGDKDFSNNQAANSSQVPTVDDLRYTATSLHETTSIASITIDLDTRETFYNHGNDYLYGGAGKDTIYGDGGSDYIEGGAGNDIILGDDNKTKLLGKFHGNDTIYAGDGNDQIWGSGGNDTIYGGADDDYIDGDAHKDNLEEDQNGIDTLFGADGKDTIFGGGKKDYLYGGEGDDYLHGDASVASLGGQYHDNDTLYGDIGKDTLVGGGKDDRLYGGDGDDQLNGDSNDLGGQWHGNDYLDGGLGNDDLDGGGGTDYLYGGDGDDLLIGDGGVDVAYQLTDHLYGGKGNDQLQGNGGADYLYGGEDDDSLFGDEGDDKLYAGTGHNSLYGGTGNDELAVGDGNDTLDGGAGNDVLNAGAGNNRLNGGDGNDQLYAGNGNDSLDGGSGNDVLNAGNGDNMLFGGAGNDQLIGGSSVDRIYGGQGDDTLYGGQGNDLLYGGKGSDHYEFNLGDGQDVITEELSDMADVTYDNFVHFNFNQDAIRGVVRDGFDLLIGYGTGDQVTVKDYYRVRNITQEYNVAPVFEQIEVSGFSFADGSVWTTSDIFDRAPPPDQNDLPHDPLEGVAYFVDALISREDVKVLGKQTLYYGFAGVAKPNETGFALYSAEQRLAVEAALNKFAEVLNVQFVYNTNPTYTQNDFTFVLDDLISAGAGAAAGYASAQTGEIHMNSQLYAASDSLNAGTHGFEVLLHEISHAMGLKHPFEAPVLREDEEHTGNTLMSYTDEGEGIVHSELMMYDIAALQYLHGVNPNHNTGATSYGFNTKYIWDASGTDTFNASSETQSVTIDLNAGGWSHRGEKNSSILAEGQTFIGYNTWIENARGGSGNDRLIGNQNSNQLYGGVGNDQLAGGAGSDTLYGGAGNDQYEFKIGDGQDQIIDTDTQNAVQINTTSLDAIYLLDNRMYYSASDAVYGNLANVSTWIVNGVSYTASELNAHAANIQTYSTADTHSLGETQSRGLLLGSAQSNLVGNALNNTLIGNSANNSLEGGIGNDTLFGGDGVDILNGGIGTDVMIGGSGDDTYYVDDVADQVSEFEYGGTDHVISSISYTLGNDVEQLTLTGTAIEGIGNKFANNIIGNDQNNILKDGGTSAEVYGGQDLLTGGLGDDTYYVTETQTEIDEQQDQGIDHVIASVNHQLDNHVENLTLTAGSLGQGNWLDNVITGNQAANHLLGYGGNDTLVGAKGSDVLEGGSGSDIYVFNVGDGLDEVIDDKPSASADNNVIKFIGLLSSQVSVGLESNELVIRYGLNDSITIKDFLKHQSYDDPRYNYATNQPYTVPVQTISMKESVQELHFADGEVRTLTSYFDDLHTTMIGTDQGDQMTGATLLRNEMSGGLGADKLTGGTVSDRIYGGAGNDTIDAAAGDDLIYGGDGNDTVVAGAGVDFIHGEAGDDVITAGTGDDIVYGGADNDTLSGGQGVDQLYGDLGDDTLYANEQYNQSNEADTLYGGEGNDELYGGQMLYGGAGRDLMYAGSGAQLYGGEGNDSLNIFGGSDGDLNGGAGDDSLSASGGSSNHLKGGDGDDALSVSGGSGNLLNGGAGYDHYSVGSATGSVIQDSDSSGKIHIDAHAAYVPWTGNSIEYVSYTNSLLQYSTLVSSNNYSSTYQLGTNNFRNAYFVYDVANETVTLKTDRVLADGEFSNLPKDSDYLIFNGISSFEVLDGFDIEVSNASVSHYNQNIYFNGFDVSMKDFVDQGTVISIYGNDNDTIHGVTEYAGGRIKNRTGTIGDIIYAGGGNNIVNTGVGSSNVFSESGSDIIYAVDIFATDIVYSGSGNDIIYTYDPNVDYSAGAGINPYLDLYGTYTWSPSETLVVRNYDSVYAGDGSDIIYTGHQKAEIYGGAGDDQIIASFVTDTYIDNLTDSGYERGMRGSGRLYGDGGNDLLVGSGELYGGMGNDTLTALGGYTKLDGGEGADILVGSDSGHNIFVVDQFDTIYAGQGLNSIMGLQRSIDLEQENFIDVTLGGFGNYNLLGNSLDNRLTGNDGDNYLDGRGGSNQLFGGKGSDYYVLRSQADSFEEESLDYVMDEDGNYIDDGYGNYIQTLPTGVDTIERWFSSNYVLDSNIENLVLRGTASAGFGNDQDNIITGSTQNNYINGLGGNDTYVFAKGGATDTYNFQDDIDAFNVVKITGYQHTEVSAQRQGDSVYLSFKNSSDHIWLSNYYVADTTDEFGSVTTNKVDQIEFDSGVIWTQADIQTAVDRAASNRAPTVNAAIPQIKTNQGTAFSYTIPNTVITDPDVWDSLTFRVTATTQTNGQYNPIPSWLSFDPETRTLSGTPPAGTTGSFSFYYWGTDMYGRGTGTSFSLTVNPPNRPPIIANPIIDQTATDGKAFSYTIASNAFSDPDGDTLAYSVTLEDGSAIPAWLSFNATTRTISGTSPDNSSPLNIRMIARDTANQTVSDVFKITFVVQNLTVNGTTAADTLSGGSGNDTLTGQAGNDTLYGLFGNDILNGGTGNDVMYGGQGDDTYVVDSVSDSINENVNEGIDTVQSSVTLSLNTNVENLTLTGTTAINGTGNALNNIITGNSANNTLSGGAGDDVLNGGAGTDTLIGGVGNDVYIVDSTTDTITENANEGTDTVQSSVTYTLTNANLENLTLLGTAAINGTGNALNNTLVGNSGNNTLNGGTGADSLIGGLGNDLYIVDHVSDLVVENTAEGTDTVQSSVSYSLANHVENITLTGTAAASATGNDMNNLLTGNSANNTLNGGVGDDTLNGGAGTDTLIGGIGNDIYVVDSTTDTITENTNEGIDTVQSSVTYTLTNANLENLTLIGTSAINGTGNALSNMIIGNSAVNTLTGGAGDDWLDGGAGNDKLFGGTGNDTYVINSTSDVVTEAANEGIDTVRSTVTYTLGSTSNLENLTLLGTAAINATGNALDNVLIGNSAINTLTGGLGNDWLDGGAGNDKLLGGAGNDTYVIDSASDAITENANEGIDSVQSTVTYTLGSNLENLELIGVAAINATGNTLANTLKGNSANNLLTGGAGSDRYLFDRNSAIDTIVENDSTAGNKDQIAFAADIAANQLWLTKTGNNLEVSVIGTGNKVVVKDWYLGNAYHVEELKSGNGLTLVNSQVQNLVNAMSSLTPPAAGQTTLPAEYQTQLNSVIASNWQ